MVIQKRSVYVRLHDISQCMSVLVLGLPDKLVDISERSQLDASPTVCVLSWLHDPHFVGFPLVLFHESFVFNVFRRSYVVGLRDVVERIFVSYLGEIVEEGFE